MDKENWLSLLSGSNVPDMVLETNSYTNRFGLVLSREDAELLLSERIDVLQEVQRVEFGSGILQKLIFAFCDSPYIYQDNYVDSIGRLQQIFYLYKNESLDEVTDDELIDYMVKEFNGRCEGSFDFLEDTSLVEFAEKIRKGTLKFIGAIRNEETDDYL